MKGGDMQLTDEQIKVKAELKEEEKALYEHAILNNHYTIEAFESLALARIKERELKAHIKTFEWIPDPFNLSQMICLSCLKDKSKGHAPDCKTKRLLEE